MPSFILNFVLCAYIAEVMLIQRIDAMSQWYQQECSTGISSTGARKESMETPATKAPVESSPPILRTYTRQIYLDINGKFYCFYH